jgi:hypothetical protein
MQDFVQGFTETLAQPGYDQARISNKIASTTSDDFYEYQNQVSNVHSPFRRIGLHAANLPENVPVIQKVDPKLANVVEMLKNLRPKANHNDSFIIRYARALNSFSSNLNVDKNETGQISSAALNGKKIK